LEPDEEIGDHEGTGTNNDFGIQNRIPLSPFLCQMIRLNSRASMTGQWGQRNEPGFPVGNGTTGASGESSMNPIRRNKGGAGRRVLQRSQDIKQ
jgi:hypothetical protein